MYIGHKDKMDILSAVFPHAGKELRITKINIFRIIFHCFDWRDAHTSFRHMFDYLSGILQFHDRQSKIHSALGYARR